MNVGFEIVDVSALRPSERNPNSGNVEAIAESIKANGFYSYIIADKNSKEVLVGNHRLKAAISLKMKRVPVIWVEATEKQAAWLLAQDNRLAHFGWRDEQTLFSLLQELNSMEGTGYTDEDFEDLQTYLRRLEPPESTVRGQDADQERFQRGTYNISLVYEPGTYPRVVQLMDCLMERHGATSYADALLAECKGYGH